MDDHASDDDLTALFTEASWDERYSESDRVWSGKPNQRLVEQVADLTPSTALDVGCGEGGDVLWLAEHGWQVTGVDVSGVALRRAEAHARERGVGASTWWLRADVIAGDPLPGGLGLVSAAFLHLPDPHFDAGYLALAGSVAPGGTLLVIAHHPDDNHTGLRNPRLAELMFGPEKVTRLLDPGQWQVLVADTPTRTVRHHDGDREVSITDTVVRAVRRN